MTAAALQHAPGLPWRGMSCRRITVGDGWMPLFGLWHLPRRYAHYFLIGERVAMRPRLKLCRTF